MMEAVFKSKMHTVRVTAVEYLHSRLKWVRFEGDFADLRFDIGHAISFRVDENNFRNYTPSVFDAEQGVCEVIFHLHGHGPGSLFADQLKEGDVMRIVEPRGRGVYRENNYHFFAGDETTVGLYESLRHKINQQQQNYLGILEFADIAEVPSSLDTSLEVVRKGQEYGVSTMNYLKELHPRIWNLWKEGNFYLSGNAQFIQRIAKGLRDAGVRNRNIIKQVYWAEGKIGLSASFLAVLLCSLR